MCIATKILRFRNCKEDPLIALQNMPSTAYAEDAVMASVQTMNCIVWNSVVPELFA